MKHPTWWQWIIIVCLMPVILIALPIVALYLIADEVATMIGWKGER